MIKARFSQTVFQSRIREYASTAKKEIGQAVKEEAKLTAQALMKLTPPKTASAGKARIKSDIERVYLQPKWFTEVFQFKLFVVEENVKKMVREANIEGLTTFFQRSAKLSRLHLEPFNTSIIERFRHGGRVAKRVAPFSFPLQDEGQRKAYEQRKLKTAGMAKSGWAACFQMLGGSAAGWLTRSNTGEAVKNSEESYTLVNKVKYMAELSSKLNIIPFALANRQRSLSTKIAAALRSAARKR